MKEADIEFGALYAVSIDNTIVCKNVRRKVPPEPGKQRSRTYIITEPNEPVGTYPDTIDASKIVMRWSDYERTPEYQFTHLDTVRRDLEHKVALAIEDWWKIVGQTVAALSGGRLGYSHLPLSVRQSETIEVLLENVMQQTATIPLGKLVDLADLPIPSMESIRLAMEMRDEVVTDLRRQMLPAADARLADSIKKDQYGNLDFDVAAYNEYLAMLRSTQQPGPHDALIKLARTAPKYHVLTSLTQEPQFHYLIPHLDFS